MMISTAFILCGGEGIRLKPLTDDIPKTLLPINGKPILEYNIELMKRNGIKKIILGTGHLGDQIKNYFGNGEHFDVDISYSHEEQPLGTGGALKLVSKIINDTFIMCNGDELKDVDIRKMFDVHKQNNADITIALTSVNNPQLYGVALLEGDRIIKFLEKPENPPTNMINSGLYILEPKIFSLIPEGKVSIERDIFPKIAENKKLFGFKFDGKWLPTDTPEKYHQAKKSWNPY